MTLVERTRIAAAVVSYDLWLDLRGVPGRRRRDLRRELRANLTDAAADVGVGTALDRLGGTRRLAAQAVVDDGRRPRWSVGATAAVVTLGLLLWVYLMSALAFADGVQASGVTDEVVGAITLLPGSTVSAHFPADGGLSVGVGVGWPVLLAPLAVFVLVARPWRLVTRRRADAAARD